MTNTIQQKAEELVTLVMGQIEEEREVLAQRMIELGYTDESHVIADNIVDVIADPTATYRCWAEVKPRLPRGANDGTI